MISDLGLAFTNTENVRVGGKDDVMELDEVEKLFAEKEGGQLDPALQKILELKSCFDAGELEELMQAQDSEGWHAHVQESISDLAWSVLRPCRQIMDSARPASVPADAPPSSLAQTALPARAALDHVYLCDWALEVVPVTNETFRPLLHGLGSWVVVKGRPLAKGMKKKSNDPQGSGLATSALVARALSAKCVQDVNGRIYTLLGSMDPLASLQDSCFDTGLLEDGFGDNDVGWKLQVVEIIENATSSTADSGSLSNWAKTDLWLAYKALQADADRSQDVNQEQADVAEAHHAVDPEDRPAEVAAALSPAPKDGFGGAAAVHHDVDMDVDAEETAVAPYKSAVKEKKKSAKRVKPVAALLPSAEESNANVGPGVMFGLKKGSPRIATSKNPKSKTKNIPVAKAHQPKSPQSNPKRAKKTPARQRLIFSDEESDDILNQRENSTASANDVGDISLGLYDLHETEVPLSKTRLAILNDSEEELVPRPKKKTTTKKVVLQAPPPTAAEAVNGVSRSGRISKRPSDWWKI
ncbi:hypothetical protein HDU91_006827 [Kappamyces sp. JEL0680]|nr:hypothetical protein HDU91_006827 [Kappamyces sp. JEL0680]